MEEAKHTPGPWVWVRRPSGYCEALAGNGEEVFRADEYAGAAWIAISDADARLIAAAPELLEVLVELMDVLRKEAPGATLNNHRFDGLGIKAYDAIAKATTLTIQDQTQR